MEKENYHSLCNKKVYLHGIYPNHGKRGPTGPRGPTGDMGPTGATGPPFL